MDKAKEGGATALNVLSAPLFSVNRRLVIERAAGYHTNSLIRSLARRGPGDALGISRVTL
jgi:hypothetical protein